MLFLGSLVTLLSILLLVDGFRSSRWPKIDGFIVDAKLHEMYTAGDRIFWPEVNYEYVVADNKLDIGENRIFNKKIDAPESVKRHAPRIGLQRVFFLKPISAPGGSQSSYAGC
jgi:hypothetical protein